MKNENLLHVRDMDFALGFITEEEYERLVKEEQENALRDAIREARTNFTLNEISDAIEESAWKELDEK